MHKIMITLTREEAQQVLYAMEAIQAYTHVERKGLRIFDDAVELFRARLAQPEPEPVAWMNESDMGRTDWKVWAHGKPTATIPLYTAPPQREWQGLTDEEIRNEAKNHVFDESFFSGAIWARGQIMGKNNE